MDVLNELPKIGKMVVELNDEAVKELLLYSYRIIYEIRSKLFEVRAVSISGRIYSQKRF